MFWDHLWRIGVCCHLVDIHGDHMWSIGVCCHLVDMHRDHMLKIGVYAATSWKCTRTLKWHKSDNNDFRNTTDFAWFVAHIIFEYALVLTSGESI